MMFHYLENFHKNLERKSRYGVSFFECENAINEVCNFFGIPAPAFIQDLTDHPQGNTMFVDRNRLSYADDIICYSMEQLKALGVNSKDAFSLVMTHECTHRVLQNTNLPGLDHGQWEQELCCDYFMGVRAGLDKITVEALQSVRNGLAQSEGSKSHPNGQLRYDVISYGWTWVGNMDLIQRRRRTFKEYLAIFEQWRQKHAEEIRLAQMPFYGERV